MSLMVGIFPFLGIVNGFISARMYKFFNGTNWITLAVISSGFVSGFFSSCLTAIYLLEFIETERFVVSEILVVILAWLGINGPSTALGTYIGFKLPKLEVEAKPTRLPRKAPKETTCLLNPVLCFIFCSVIPFSVIGAQFYYIFSSVSGG